MRTLITLIVPAGASLIKKPAGGKGEDILSIISAKYIYRATFIHFYENIPANLRQT